MQAFISRAILMVCLFHIQVSWEKNEKSFDNLKATLMFHRESGSSAGVCEVPLWLLGAMT